MLGRLKKKLTALALNVPRKVEEGAKTGAMKRWAKANRVPVYRTRMVPQDQLALRLDVGNIHVQVLAQSPQPIFFSQAENIYPKKNIRNVQS